MPLLSAMYSVEITVEKDKVTGETRVLSSTTLLPRDPLPQGVKVYEDETKGMRSHASCRGTRQSPGRPPSPSFRIWAVCWALKWNRGSFNHRKAQTCHSEQGEEGASQRPTVASQEKGTARLAGASWCKGYRGEGTAVWLEGYWEL